MAEVRERSYSDTLVNGDAYDGTLKMTMQQGAMTMNMSGKRVSDCTP